MDEVSTAEVPPQERLAFWREVCSKIWVPLDARCEPGADCGFRARVALGELGPVRAALMTTMPHSVHRTPKLIRRDDPEALLLTCAVRGPGVLAEQDGRRAESQIGDLCLFDSSRPYLAGVVPGTPGGRVLVLQFPRSLLPVPPRDLQRLSAVRIPGDRGIGALSSQFLLRLAQHMDELSPSDTARLSTLTLDVVTSALANALDAQDAVPPHVRQRALMTQIRTFIQKNLGDARLTPEAIAAAHHISLRYLHRLFQDDGHTVAGWVRERRLEQCRREIGAYRPTNRTFYFRDS